jgi:hypothetical protein
MGYDEREGGWLSTTHTFHGMVIGGSFLFYDMHAGWVS